MDRGRRRRAAAGAARGPGREKRIQVHLLLAFLLSAFSPLFLLLLLRRRLPAAQGESREGSQSFCLSACAAARRRLSPRRRRRLRQHRLRPPALLAAAAAAGWGWLRLGRTRAGAALRRGGRGDCGRALRSRGRGCSQIRGGGSARGGWRAAARGPCSLLARSAPGTARFSCEGAGFGAQPGAGRSQSRAPERAGRRVGRRAPLPGTWRCSSGPRDPGQPRAGARGGSASRGCPSVHPPPPPAPLRWLPLAQLGGRARQMLGAWSRPLRPGPPGPRRPRGWRTGPRRAPRPRSTPEETGGKSENEKVQSSFSFRALPMTLHSHGKEEELSRSLKNLGWPGKS